MSHEKKEKPIILKNAKDKVKFLKDCLEQINRIEKSIGDPKMPGVKTGQELIINKESERENDIVNIGIKLPRHIESAKVERIDPRSSDFVDTNSVTALDGYLTDIISDTEPKDKKQLFQVDGARKLDILYSIYNMVADSVHNHGENEEINLTKTFHHVKLNYQKENINIHHTMSAHRTSYLKDSKNMFAKFITWLMPPKSKQFLEKYEFFKATADIKPDDDDLDHRSSTSSRRGSFKKL